MKKTLVIILTIFFVIITILVVELKALQREKIEINQFNKEYENYLGKQLYGTEVTTIINKAMKNNKDYHIEKDDKGIYINDNKYCIKVELNMITVEKTFQMEQIYNAGITEFVKNFNLIAFECTSIEYHKETGRISKIIFTQLEE